MSLSFFQVAPQKFLGIDIGTSSIKIVEISRRGARRGLENYGEISAKALYGQPFRTFEKNILTLSSQDIAKGIRAILQEANIKIRQAGFSIPDFSTFYASFKIPSMEKKKLAQAVKYEARRYIPLPVSEVTLDWQVIKEVAMDQNKFLFEVLVVAIPNEIIHQYQEIANLANLEANILEAEVFSLERSLLKSDEMICLIDIGAKSTTVSVVEKKVLKKSYSFDMSGDDFNQQISKSLEINHEEAEDLKKIRGLKLNGELREVLEPLIDSILTEVGKISHNLYQSKGKGFEKFIIAGGSALVPGLQEYFSEKLNGVVEIADPFSDLFFPPILEKTLKTMGPSYAIAVGMALKGLE